MNNQPRKLGYIRVSTQNQYDKDTHLAQKQLLTKYGCDIIYTDIISGKNPNPPHWENLLKASKPGDVVVIFRLDRLGRTLFNCLKKFEQLTQHRLTLVILDTISGQGQEMSKFHVQILGAVSELEMELREQRCKAGKYFLENAPASYFSFFVKERKILSVFNF